MPMIDGTRGGRRRAVCAVAAWLLASLPAQAQTPRMPWGAPDLRGIWSHATATPLERPAGYAGRERLTAAEIATVDAEARSTDGEGARRAVWWERGLSDGRTALIVDPADGRIPDRDDTAQQRVRLDATADGPEDRNLATRCLSYGVPRLGGPYSQHIHLLQTPDHVAFLYEMVHEVRIVPLDRRPPVHPSVTQWLGDARGRWEGDTLVVETARFDARQLFRGFSQASLRLTERFTRVDGDTMDYAVTFEDVTLWTRPWTATLTMPRTEGPIFEFACHEGNYGMTSLLEIGRLEDAAARGAR